MNNILERITELREIKGWNQNQLSNKSGIPYTTISSWIANDTVPSIKSLKMICNALDITLSQFFSDDNVIELTPTQKRLIEYSNKLNNEQMEALINFLKELTK